eukprot:41457-Amorphochlora_amoeboformis.AAC.1
MVYFVVHIVGYSVRMMHSDISCTWGCGGRAHRDRGTYSVIVVHIHAYRAYAYTYRACRVLSWNDRVANCAVYGGAYRAMTCTVLE